MRTITRETIIDRRQPVLRWSAIFGGTAIGVGVWVLLEMLAAGIGLVAMNIDAGGMPRSAIWLGVGAMIAPILAMFFAGLVAARFCGAYGRGIGALHGLVVWALTAVTGLCARVALLMAMLSGIAVENVGPETVSRAEALDAVGRALLFGGAVLGLGLIAAVLGGLAGVRRRGFGVSRTTEYPTVTRTEVPVSTEITPPPPPVQPMP